MELTVLYEDEHLIAIHKPCGLLVHRTRIANDATEFALQILRDQIGQKVYPVHRLDRKTSGVLLFAKNEFSNRLMQQQFMSQNVKKKYLAIVRGWVENDGTIDSPLINDSGKKQEAITHFSRVQKVEIPLAHGKFDSSRYSFIEVQPETGRMHQIRKHFAHLRHPIIGDRPHGCNKQNRLFKEKFSMTKLMLHASELEFTHPVSEIKLKIQCDYSDEFKRMIIELEF